MITVKVNGEKYTISKDFSVSDGVAKEFIEHCIEILQNDYKLWMGFFEPYLYTKLAAFKSIEVVSMDYDFPKEKNIVY
jgi:hypothetical protein